MKAPQQHSIEFRVQYYETDAQGRVHHGQYVNYFERGRIELLRACGKSYRDFERQGLLLVVTEMQLQYLGGAEFDDLLRLTTFVEATRGVRIQHSYQIEQYNPLEPEAPLETIVRGTSVVACVDRQGKVRPLPKEIRDLHGR